jgi:hypothetical protein
MLLDSIGVMGLRGILSFVWKSTTGGVVYDVEETDALVLGYCSVGTNIGDKRSANTIYGKVLGFEA